MLTSWLFLFVLALLMYCWGNGYIVFFVGNRVFECGEDRLIVRVSDEEAQELISMYAQSVVKRGGDHDELKKID